MNPNYIHTITIFNCLRAADNPNEKKDIWQKTVLKRCFYKNAMEQSDYVARDPRMANTYTVRIPQSDKYLQYKEWVKLPESERLRYFTCSIKDIIVYGDCAEVITGISPDTAAEVLSKCKPDAFNVTAFSDNTSHKRAKHYRAGG